ncbi:30S ribosomal protein S2 [Borreliella americana]|uniref:30S ribosomal protein S2 n=1 Tax=Borreliella americana TaxID=478807 RepID=UPI001E32F75B|nr:30S ribosomal protein S2 [Borreliella americana]MCD2331995.1 30S ribosomal protein S2 [Borreliella americana]MCD2349769.1 30S ribosomal protein S2 [Borreliella americana]MCD2382373.1 30S ribosomal protein S2 [Borreliella americana]
MAIVTMKSLLEAGVHFGHQVKRLDPRMKRFIFSERNEIHILDLQKTLQGIKDSYELVQSVIKDGKKVLFIGTKKQASEIIEQEARRSDMPYVNNRWLGGMLSNFNTIRKSVQKLKKLEKMEVDGTFDMISKKEISQLNREKSKLAKNLTGIKDMETLPGAIFIIDPKREQIAINEARKLKIPIISVVDTNCNPDVIDCPIPGNDDAIRSVALFTKIISDAILESDKEVGIQIIENLNEEDLMKEIEIKNDKSDSIEERGE